MTIPQHSRRLILTSIAYIGIVTFWVGPEDSIWAAAVLGAIGATLGMLNLITQRWGGRNLNTRSWMLFTTLGGRADRASRQRRHSPADDHQNRHPRSRQLHRLSPASRARHLAPCAAMVSKRAAIRPRTGHAYARTAKSKIQMTKKIERSAANNSGFI